MSAVVVHPRQPRSPRGETRETREIPWWDSSIRVADLDLIEYPPLEYLVPEVLPVGGLVLLAGAPKAGKSVLAMGFALAVASGGRALGASQAQQGEVLFLSLDDQSRPRAQRRIRDLLRGESMPAGMVLHTEPNLQVGKAAAANLSLYLAAHPRVRLVVIDTLEHLRGDRPAGVSVYSADVRFLNLLRQVVADHPGVCILAVTHTRKGDGDEDPIEAVSGSHGVTGGADAVLVLSGRRGVPRRVLDVVSRDDEDKRLVLTMTPNGLTLTDEDPDDPTVLMSEEDARIYRAVSEFPDGVTAKDLEPLLPNVKKIGNRLAGLKNKGYLRMSARGVYVA